MSDRDVASVVQERYGEIARQVREGARGSCCTGACGCDDPITSNLYPDAETRELPAQAVAASLGCGNPTLLAQLNPGDVVLDLGSGGGIDVLLSAKRVGPTGRAYGLDMTEDMLALARDNQRRSGVTNVEFLKGRIEAIPLPDATVDVIISNCVINLSGDKDRVLAEAFRVLKPGGRFAVSDVIVRRPLPGDVRRSLELWVGCVAGALEEREYRAKLERAGFSDVEIEITREYRAADIFGERALASEPAGAERGVGAPARAGGRGPQRAPRVGVAVGGFAGAEPPESDLDGAVASAFIRATKALPRV